MAHTEIESLLCSAGVWKKVVFAADCQCSCGEPSCAGECGCPLVCAECGGDYADCGCPGPTQDGIEYQKINGMLYGKNTEKE